jgi:drug/metabolite transporter (DMT)-like permease
MLIAVVLSVSNAAYYLLIRRLNASASPFLLGTAFRVICLLLFAARAAYRGELRLMVSPEVRRALPWLLLVAACNTFIEAGTIVGLRLTTALNATLLGRLDILFAGIIGAMFFQERLRKSDAWAIALLVIGCAGIFSVRLNGIETHAAGDLMVSGAALLMATNAFVIRFKLAALPNDVIAFHNVLYSTVPLAIASLWETRALSFAALDVVLLLLLGVAVYGSYVSYYAALKAMAVWRVRTLLLLVPAIVLGVGALMLRDPVSKGQIGGAALVAAGEALLVWSAKRPVTATGEASRCDI